MINFHQGKGATSGSGIFCYESTLICDSLLNQLLAWLNSYKIVLSVTLGKKSE